MTFKHPQKARPPLDSAALERLALGYVGRYATSRAKLRDYLRRKMAERGWSGPDKKEGGGDAESGAEPGDSAALIEQLIERFAELGYVDDRAVAEARARSLGARGYGARRLDGALGALGIGEADGRDARQQARDGAWEAALLFARKRRIGPFADRAADETARRRAFGAMMRAGHSTEHAKRIIAAPPGDVPSWDE